ncbi:hypothetical protein AVEN_56449-1 [Araneus ventricosus]|uniref:Uncharacterized protein n=1 Tax=Araneus ventricosus TaxID=182803 RepID=A0A4Y2QQJ4_ARAVE|nr:hypothetical protein AVEN_56449-1 [Araneus ventricosus]
MNSNLLQTYCLIKSKVEMIDDEVSFHDILQYGSRSTCVYYYSTFISPNELGKNIQINHFFATSLGFLVAMISASKVNEASEAIAGKVRFLCLTVTHRL